VTEKKTEGRQSWFDGPFKGGAIFAEEVGSRAVVNNWGGAHVREHLIVAVNAQLLRQVRLQ